MKWFIALLLGLLVWGENQATYCGQGLIAKQLPHGIKVNWFNGTLWVLDHTDFGLISTSSSGASMGAEYFPDNLGVYKIIEYGYKDDVYFKVKTTDDDINYVGVTMDSVTRNDLIFFGEKAMPGEFKIDDYRWHSVSMSDCFYGRYSFIRIVLLLLLFFTFILQFRKVIKLRRLRA